MMRYSACGDSGVGAEAGVGRQVIAAVAVTEMDTRTEVTGHKASPEGRKRRNSQKSRFCSKDPSLSLKLNLNLRSTAMASG